MKKTLTFFFENILQNEDLSVFYHVENIDDYIGEKKSYDNFGNEKYESLRQQIESVVEREYACQKNITLVVYDTDTEYSRYNWGFFLDAVICKLD